MKVSFIVPVYNVRDYLSKCIESLLHQDYDDYEIVIVDDGSTDGSGALADEWSKKTDKIVVSHQENHGVSVARNKGVEIASGDYITFVDSDDYWSENVLSALIRQIKEQDLDVLRFRYQNVRETGEVFVPNKAKNINDYSKIPLDGLSFLNQRMGLQCYACQFVIKKSICEKEPFMDGIYFEDVEWLPRVMFCARKVSSIDIVVYNYLWRTSSITLERDIIKIRKRVLDKISILQRYNIYSLPNDWFDGMRSALILSVVGDLAKELFRERHYYCDKISELRLKLRLTPKIDVRLHWKIIIFNISIQLLILILHIKQIVLNVFTFNK